MFIKRFRKLSASILIFCCFLVAVEIRSEELPLRSQDNLVLYYDFSEVSGPFVKDRSGHARAPLHLKMDNPKKFKRIHGGLRINGGKLVSHGNAKGLSTAVKKSGELSIEAWIQPATLNQGGPARVLTFSQNGSQRNFTLGQEGDDIDVRLRTTKTSGNGIPSTSAKNVLANTKVVHVVYTKSRSGKTSIHLNGVKVGHSKVDGNLNNWNDNYRVAVGDEISGGRQWKGNVFLLAVYDKALSTETIKKHFKAGHNVGAPAKMPVQVAKSPKEIFFETQVAPVIAKHCLECHDASNQKGKLDLSRKQHALAGGESGDTIVPGQADKSELFLSVLHDEMPDERELLSDDEKAILKKWINDGAVWSFEFIDPALYVHGRDGGQEVVRRLTVNEYVNSVKSVTGVDISEEAKKLLPKDIRADGFSNTAYNLGVDLKHVETFAKLASIIVGKMDVKEFSKKFSSRIGFTDNQMGELINKMGAYVLRGPLDKGELFLFRGISTTVAGSGGNYEEAVSYILEAMLQSPRFIYRIENQKGDGTQWPVDEYELASRLSFLVWGTAPDLELLKSAQSGDLLDNEGILQTVDRMLSDPKAILRSKEFLSEWLNLGRLNNMNPNPKRFPKWDPVLASDMSQETLKFFLDVVWEKKRPLHEIFNSKFTYVTPRLAKHYGLPEDLIPQGLQAAEFFKVQLPNETGRSGIFTHGSLLTVGGDEASMVARGLFLMHEFLRGVVKDPPPCVDTTVKPSKAGLSQRNIAQQRIDNKSCGGCHEKFEPLAFGFEKFDGLGSFHLTDEHGNTMREDGEVLVPGQSRSISFDKVIRLADILADSERVRQTIAWKAVQFAIGRPLVASDAPVLENIYSSWQKSGGTYQALVRTIATSKIILTKTTEEE